MLAGFRSVKHIARGDNTLFFSLLRDAPFFQPSTNFYAIALKSFDLDETKTVLLRDVSSSPKAYQQFEVTGSTTTEDLSNAVVIVAPYGMRYYTVYPCSGDTLADVDTSNALAKGIIYFKESV